MFQVPRDMVGRAGAGQRPLAVGLRVRRQDQQLVQPEPHRTDLWPGKTANARGFNALKAILGELYGLDIRYYVKVDFQGFRKVVDTLGGVQINVQMPVYESLYPAKRRQPDPRLHPGRAAAHVGHRGAHLRPVAPPRAGRRLRPRPPPAAGPALAPRADERAGDRRQPAEPRGGPQGLGQDRHPDGRSCPSCSPSPRASTPATSARTCSRRASTRPST